MLSPPHCRTLSLSFSLSLSVALSLSSSCLRTNSIVLPSRSVSLPSSRLCWWFYQDPTRLVINGNTYTFNKIETYVANVATHDRGCSIFYSHGESATSSARKRGRREQLNDKHRANRAKLSSVHEMVTPLMTIVIRPPSTTASTRLAVTESIIIETHCELSGVV